VAPLTWPRFVLDESLVSVIEDLRPALESTESVAERDRQAPQQLVDALRASELWRLASPQDVGGMEALPIVEFEVTEAIARISTSAAWTFFIGSFHTSVPAAYVSDEAAAKMYSGSQAPVVAGQLGPIGRASVSDGGILVSGNYSWGSGINHADWVIGGAMLSDGTGPAPRWVVWLAPKASVTVADNWYVSGLAGSGSFDYVAEDLFIADGYWFEQNDPEVMRGGSRYLAPIAVQSVASHAGLAVGAAERALQLIGELAARKQRGTSKVTVADRGAFQRDLGTGFVKLSAARAHLVGLLNLSAELSWREDPACDGHVAELMAAATNATDVAVEVAEMSYRHAGGDSVRLDSPIGRVLRDLLVARQHVVVTDAKYELAGQWVIRRAGEPSELELTSVS
jgi:indole-3-acetate monooxygenase